MPPEANAAPVSDAVHFLRFRPPRVALDAASGDPAPLPHIRLDRALEFLLGDQLA
jgi:predicted YcjX-like family ATPase